MREFRMRAGALEYFRSNGAGRAVGAVHHNVQPFSARDGTRQPVQVVVAQPGIAGKRRFCLAVLTLCGIFSQQCKDFFFDFQFNFVRQLVAIGAKDLDAVVAPGIVRGGNHHARGKTMSVG